MRDCSSSLARVDFLDADVLSVACDESYSCSNKKVKCIEFADM